MLQGERGVLRKEFDKLVDWTKDEPVPDVINLPNSLLISMAAPLKRALGRPVCVTLQGEELFIDCARAALSRTGAGADSAPGPRRRSASSPSATTARDSCRRSWRFPASECRSCPLGIAMDGYSRRDDARRRRTRRFVSAIWRESRRRRGCICWREAYVRLRRAMNGAPARLEVAGYMAAGSSPVSRRALARCWRRRGCRTR